MPRIWTSVLVSLVAMGLSCRSATQITVSLEGEGVVCGPAQQGKPGYAGAGVLGRKQLTGPSDLDGALAYGRDSECSGAEPIALGSVVLVPEDGVGPVEILAVGALAPDEGQVVTVDECLAEYEAFLAGQRSACLAGEKCSLCIFARRSLGFVEYQNLNLKIMLSNACAGVLCEASQTCAPELGCVSATVTCAGDTCDEPTGEGGAGAGGGGGSGGGGGPSVWRELPVPASAQPLDVVGFNETLDPVAGTTRFLLFVAAGPEMLVYEDGEALVDSGASQPYADAYVAVAARTGNETFDAVATMGSVGLTTSANGFATSGAPNPIQALDFDVAWRADHSGAELAIDYSGTAATCAVSDYPLQALPSEDCGAALFAVAFGPAEAMLACVATDQAMDEDGAWLTNVEPLSLTSTDWSLWGRVPAGGNPEGYCVASTGDVVRFSETGGQVLSVLVPSNPAPGATIDAVWGWADATGVETVRLYAVGQRTNQEAGFLAFADLAVSSAGASWAELSLPPELVKPRSIWVGLDASRNEDVVVVVGERADGQGAVLVASRTELEASL